MRFVGLFVLVTAGVSPLACSDPSPQSVSGGRAPSPSRGAASPDLTPTTAAAKPELRRSALSIRSIETHTGPKGAQNFVIVFDGPVPDDSTAYVESITAFDASRVAYSTQEWTPNEPVPLRTCGDQHFGFSPAAIVGQVDVLMPSEWFEAPPDPDKVIWTQSPQGYGAKTPLCGPHDGYVQFAIWSPTSHDLDDIQVYFDDPTRLVVEIRPGRG